jgi:hypothetical protein
LTGVHPVSSTSEAGRQAGRQAGIQPHACSRRVCLHPRSSFITPGQPIAAAAAAAAAATAATLPPLCCVGAWHVLLTAWATYVANFQALDTAVSRVVRFLLFKHHEKPGVPVKRQEISDVISVSDISRVFARCFKNTLYQQQTPVARIPSDQDFPFWPAFLVVASAGFAGCHGRGWSTRTV